MKCPYQYYSKTMFFTIMRGKVFLPERCFLCMGKIRKDLNFIGPVPKDWVKIEHIQ